jgi:hypothetical protein
MPCGRLSNSLLKFKTCCCGIFTLRRTALDFGEEKEEVTKAVVDDTYVDDWLESRRSVKEAVPIAKDKSRVFEKGDFKLRGWVSNSNQLIEEIAPERRCMTKPEVQLGSEEEATVLGIVWRRAADLLSFSIRQLPERSKKRRGLAGRLASIYNPPGFSIRLLLKPRFR